MTTKKLPKGPTRALAPVRPVENLIRVLRGQKVMLDRDLAGLYGVKPIALRQQVKRNGERFPEDFMFQLDAEEVDGLLSQSVIPSRQSLGGFRPYAFTQEGIAMLSSVLRSPQAVQMNILIMRAFVRMRELIAANKDLADRLEKMESKQERTASVIEILVEDIDRLALEVKHMKARPEPRKRQIGFLAGESSHD